MMPSRDKLIITPIVLLDDSYISCVSGVFLDDYFHKHTRDIGRHFDFFLTVPSRPYFIEVRGFPVSREGGDYQLIAVIDHSPGVRIEIKPQLGWLWDETGEIEKVMTGLIVYLRLKMDECRSVVIQQLRQINECLTLA